MMLISISTGLGLQKTIQNKVSSFFGHITISNFQNNSSQLSSNPFSIEQDFYLNNNINDINHIQSVAYKSGVILTDTDFEGIVFKGINDDFNFKIFSQHMVEGKIPNINNSVTREVIISKYLSERLKLKLNQKLKVSFLNTNSSIPSERNFKISGIYDTGLNEFDEIYIIGDIKHIQLINNWETNQIGSFEIFINDFDKMKQVSSQLYEISSSNLDVVDISQKFFEIFNWIALFDMNILLIIIIMILVSGINMITALIVTILEKSKLIGVLRVVGSTKSSLRNIFLINGVYLISIGLLFGNIIGLGLIFFQKITGFIELNPETYYVSVVPVDINLFNIILLNLGIIFFCFLMLIIPSYIINRISPTDSLKIN